MDESSKHPRATNAPPETKLHVDGRIRTRDLHHLFGPVAVVTAVTAIVILGYWHVKGKPLDQTWRAVALETTFKAWPSKDSEDLLTEKLKNYQAILSKLDANIGLQAFFIPIALLLVIRRSESLKLFDNSIPLSWLHLLVPVVMIYLWLAFGFLLHDLIWERFQGVELIQALGGPAVEYRKAIFHDGGLVDGWFKTFLDNDLKSFSGIRYTFTRSTGVFLVVVLGTLVSAAHASVLAVVSIGCRRYLSENRRLRGYYLAPLIPMIILLASHVQFAWGGEHRNWIQPYVAVATVPLMMFLLWRSAVVDARVAPGTLHCLKRRQRTKA